MSKKKTSSKLVSGLLAAMMIFSSLPMTAFAAENDDTTESTFVVEIVEPSDGESEETAVAIVDETESTEDDANVTSIPVDDAEPTDVDTEDEEIPPIDLIVDTPIEETDETLPVDETEATEAEAVDETETTEALPVEETEEFVVFDHYFSTIDEANVATSDLFVQTSNPSVFTRNTNVVSNYDDVYIISCSSVEEARFVYSYYIDKVDAITDLSAVMTVASEGDDVADMSDLNNGNDAIANLNDITVGNYSGYIALIDTGASADANFTVVGGSTLDSNGHGTSMLSYIREENPNALVMSIKAFNGRTANAADIYAALRLAIDSNVSVINMSFVSPNIAGNAIVKNAINEALANGIAVIGAAGNNNSNAQNYIPGCVESVITVGAVNSDGTKFDSSNYGADVYVVATSTSEAAARFTGMYTADNTDNDRVFSDIASSEAPENENLPDVDDDVIYEDDAWRIVVTTNENGERVYVYYPVNGDFEIAAQYYSTLDLGHRDFQVDAGASGSDRGTCYFTRGESAGRGTVSNFVSTSNNGGLTVAQFATSFAAECEGHYDNSTQSSYAYGYTSNQTLYYQATWTASEVTEGGEKRIRINWTVDFSVNDDFSTRAWRDATTSATWRVTTRSVSGAGTDLCIYTISVNGAVVFTSNPVPRSLSTASDVAQGVVSYVNQYMPVIKEYQGKRVRPGYSSIYATGLPTSSSFIRNGGLDGNSGTATWYYQQCDQYQIFERSLTAWTEAERPSIKLHKVVENGYAAVVSGNPCYNLDGTTYVLYSDAACTNALASFSFDANGNCSTIYEGAFNTTYYLRETVAGSGFLLDNEVYKITTGADASSNLIITRTSNNARYGSVSANSDNVYTATFSDIPGLDPIQITLGKSGGDLNTTAPLVGAKFQLTYYQTTGGISGVNPTAVYYFYLDDTNNYLAGGDGSVSGEITLAFLAGLTPDRGSNYLRDVYNAMMIANPNAAAVSLPVGTYCVTEIEAPKGYTLSNIISRFVVSVSEDHSTPSVRTFTDGTPDYRGRVENTLIDEGLQITYHETPVRGTFSVIKTTDLVGGTRAGYNFELWDFDHNLLIATGVTGADGVAVWTYVAEGYTGLNGEVLTGTTVLNPQVAVYGEDGVTKVNYQIREIYPTHVTYNGSSVVYPHDCPNGWSENRTASPAYYYTNVTATENANRQVTCENRPQRGVIEIAKSIENGENRTTSDTFTFDIYNIDSGNDVLLTTVSMTIVAGEASGTVTIANVPAGNYRIVERPHDRYETSYTNNTVTVYENGTHSGIFTFNITNTLKRYDINFIKFTHLADGTPVAGPAGDAHLDGAVYRIYHDANGNNSLDAGEWYADYVTEEDGSFTTADGNGVGTLIVDYVYRVYEEQAPEGYLPSDEVYTVCHRADSQNDFYAIYDEGELIYNPKTDETDVVGTLPDEVMNGRVQLIKFYNTEDANTMEPEEGAVFEIYLTARGSYENSPEWERDIITTGADGFAISKELPYGNYTAHQIGSAHDDTNSYVADWTFNFTTDGQVVTYYKINPLVELFLKVVKVDSSTNNPIPYAGATFELYRVYEDGSRVQVTEIIGGFERTEFVTDENGEIQFSYPLTVGNYELVEIEAPYGYVLANEPLPVEFTVEEVDEHIQVGASSNMRDYGLVIVEFPDDNQMFNITVEKTGEEFVSVERNEYGAYVPVWEIGHLEGAKFEIRAAEDIYTPDGTLRYEEGELVDTIITDADGVATSIELFLGSYVVTEVEAPIGYTLGGYEETVTGTYQGQEIALFDVASPACSNEHFAPLLTVHKELLSGTVSGSNGDTWSEHDYTQVTFGIYAAEEFVAADGSVIPADGLIEIIRCDADGVATSTAKYPFGSYYVLELTTDKWHFIDNTMFGFTYDCPESRTLTNPVVELGLTSVVTNTPETPSIGTTLTYNDEHIAPMDSIIELVDVVNYEGLMPNSEYEMEGTLVVVTDEGSYPYTINDEIVVERVVFTTGEANNEDGTVSGSVEVVFEVDTTGLNGKSLVAFETLYHDSAKVAIHMDINDKGQTVDVPDIRTTLVEETSCSHVAPLQSTVTLVDTVFYTNLIPNKTYLMSGTIMVKETNEPLLNSDGTPVVASYEFTPETSEGFVTITFTVDTTNLAGKHLVAFEDCSYEGLNLAWEHDIEDEDQTVVVPEIHTTATVDGNKKFKPSETITLVDQIAYEGLEPNRQYIAFGTLMTKDKDGNTVEFMVDGKPVEAYAVFTASETGSGVAYVTFTFRGTDLTNGQKLVVFEDVYEYNGSVEIVGRLMATHKDINDYGQTVEVEFIPSTGAEISKTQVLTGLGLVGLAGILSAAVITVRRKKNEDSTNA